MPNRSFMSPDDGRAVPYWGPLQTVFRTVLDPTQWGIVVGVGATVILGGELDKARQRRRGTGLG